MWITEQIKKTFLKQPKEYLDYYRDISPQKIQNVLTQDDSFLNGTVFFDAYFNAGYNAYDKQTTSQRQADKIEIYRQIAEYPEVSDAIDEIVNEIIYTPEFKDVVQLKFNGESKNFEKIFQEKFEKIYRLLNLNKNFYRIVRDSYIDGQLNLKVSYSENKKNGITNVTYLDPKYLAWNGKDEVYEYIDGITLFNQMYYSKDDKPVVYKYKIDEIVHQNFGLTSSDGKVFYSYLENAIKPANMLKTLEDLLIPLRFNRSVSRRIFNVDISDLPSSKAEAFMRKIQEQFKYKKFYNSDTGEVTNQQHITSLIEDYWFGNRSGAKGTQVELLDERGALGEMDDILYFYKKLYKSLKIPSNRISINQEADQTFDYESTQTSREDVKFYSFVDRLRDVYSNVFIDLLKREMVYSGIVKESEFNKLKENIEIFYPGQNMFVERMKLNNFMKRLESFSQARDFGANILPVKTLYEEIFKMDEKEINKTLEDINKERKNPLMKTFYPSEEENEI